MLYDIVFKAIKFTPVPKKFVTRISPIRMGFGIRKVLQNASASANFSLGIRPSVRTGSSSFSPIILISPKNFFSFARASSMAASFPLWQEFPYTAKTSWSSCSTLMKQFLLQTVQVVLVTCIFPSFYLRFYFSTFPFSTPAYCLRLSWPLMLFSTRRASFLFPHEAFSGRIPFPHDAFPQGSP